MNYTYLGPAGTFTEQALLQVPGVQEGQRVSSTSVNLALQRVRDGESDAAMVPIENSVEGGVSATLDAIASGGALQIVREVLVPISFDLVAREGITSLEQIRTVSTHGHAIAQCRGWVQQHLPNAEFVPASSTAAGALGLLDPDCRYDAAICSPLVLEQNDLKLMHRGVEDNTGAVTRFVLVTRPGPVPGPTGHDKTTVVIPLPEDHPGALMEILGQFAARGVNLSRIESRPTGEGLGSYFFSIDVEGHLSEARVADALAGLHRISPQIRFLGSYANANGVSEPAHSPARHNTDQAFRQAHAWVGKLLDPQQ
ncbi:prephenate dehydratase [Arthrobacter rhombi]|uniref:Prephenate dehydratase n=1 Tax=Arthrobacter rhombi TaxID=71253 RepID=A0A1R4ETE8_9MICC|nr:MULTISPECIES: prephenate dehydratase [Micrococcaceae]PCC24500.1 prephenate dehydratase [Glutamicibacter sp. BW78]SJM46947.1 Prephenate dehydratase [Arthrobacter rhombi]